jgi:hypothetical protein
MASSGDSGRGTRMPRNLPQIKVIIDEAINAGLLERELIINRA